MRNHFVIIAFVLLATAPLGQATFTESYQDEDDALLGVEATDASTTSIESLRHFRIDNAAAVPVYVKLIGNEGESVYLSEEGYTADVYLSKDNGATWTQVAQDVNHTNPSASLDMTSSDEPVLRVVLHFPASDRSVRVVPVAFHVALDDASSSGQNGGVPDSVFTHSARLNFYDDASDADQDGLKDAWEYEHFGGLDHPDGALDADPDGDGSTNAAEEDAGTDPNDDQDKPVGNDPPGDDPPGGGGVSNPRGVVWIASIGYAALLGVLVAALAISRRYDRPILALGGWFAALWALVSVLLWGMDAIGPGKGWAVWSYPQWNLGPLFWSVTVVAALLGGASLVMANQRQDNQRRTAGSVAGAVVVLLGGSLLYLGWLDVPTIFMG